MQKLIIIIAGIATLTFASCGAANKDSNLSDLAAKKAQLNKLKADQTKLNDEVLKLEGEIAKLDTSAANAPKSKLVSVTTLGLQNFNHYIDLQGKVDADEIVFVSPRTALGASSTVTNVFVKKGQAVKKGQLLLETDASVAEQQIKQLETQLDYSKDLYQRQKNLWEQNIGTEIQLVNAKNMVDQVERQIAVAKEQIGLTKIYAPVTGILDEFNIRVGESFTGMSGTNPQVKIVSTSNGLKVTADIPEFYLSNVKQGTPVEIEIPDLGKTIQSKVSLISQTINANSRGFIIETHIPYDGTLKPNMLAKVKIQDYSSKSTLVIPIATLQTDEKGKYVFIMATENGKTIAKKRQVQVGSVYGELIEIKGGLNVGDVVITQGYQGLYDGQLVNTESK